MGSQMRGQFYTLIAILIVVPATIFITHYVSFNSRGSYNYERIVADQAHQVGVSVEKDFERALVTSGKRGLIGISDGIIMKGDPINDSYETLKEMMENGSYLGNDSLIMFNNTINEWLSRISSIPTNFEINVNYSDLTVDNYDGFNLVFSSLLNYSVGDPLGIVDIERNDVRKEVKVSLIGMEDPLFPLKTNGLVTRTIKKTPYPYHAKRILTGGVNTMGRCSGEVTFDKSECDSGKILVAENVTGVTLSCYEGIVIEDSVDLSGSVSCFNTGNGSSVDIVNSSLTAVPYMRIFLDNETGSVWHLPIEDEIDKGYYFREDGPVYMERFEGSLSPSGNSVDTFINGRELESYGIPVKQNQISLSYLYFSDKDYNGEWVRGLPSWFKLNQTIADRYNLGELFEG